MAGANSVRRGDAPAVFGVVAVAPMPQWAARPTYCNTVARVVWEFVPWVSLMT